MRRYPTPIPAADVKNLATFHNTAYNAKVEKFHGDEDKGIASVDEFDAAEVEEMSAGVFQLTAFKPADMNANCIGWAIGEDRNVPPREMYWWTEDEGYTMCAADASAPIILWGDRNGSDDPGEWDVLHASVRLSHAQLAERTKQERKRGVLQPPSWKGFSAGLTAAALATAGIADPCHTSALGTGYGVIVHPWNWFDGGEFGEALTGVRK
ncbi:hypothetical protein GCM10023350_01590 [Nocardioides endophyticus]|uniref:Uncharacterized protein n=1 Tax=Nocardioides endophyticus TaxID=1353775 RepID=A0ABP8Y7W7_9ACTN